MSRRLKLALTIILLTFTAIVGGVIGAKPAHAAATDHYLFVYFKSLNATPNDQKIYFAVSNDGLHYTTLNKNKPTIQTGNVIRDPYILRRHDGGGFYIISTVASEQLQSRAMEVMDSTNLTDWHTKKVTVAKTNAGCVWGPEAIWNPTTKRYKVYWSQSTEASGFKNYEVATAETTNFQTFTDPQTYVSAKGQSRIDTTIIPSGNHYLRFTKNETNKTVYEDAVADLNTTNATPINNPLLSTLSGVEGPEVYQLYGQNKWIVLLDHYMSTGYEPYVSTNLEKGDLQKMDPKDYTMPKDARHGAVLPITNAEYQRLLQRFPA